MNFIYSPKMKRMICLLLTFTIFCSLLGINVFAASETTWSATQYSGTCGKNNTAKATWKMMKATNPELINNTFDYERLVISGTGEMEDYYQYTNGSTDSPWYQIVWDTNSIVVEEGITHIGDNAFIGADSICYISLPDSLESIGHYAFSSALTRVKKLTIPQNVTHIGRYALCSNEFTEVEILGDVTVLQKGVFSSCTSLKSITIPKSVISIEDDAFDYCTSLKDVYYDGTREEWEEISIGSYNTCLLNATVHFPTVNVESVSLDKTSKTMFVESTFVLTATVLPENAENKAVSWKSSNAAVATVNDGVVTAVSPGTARITVTTADGNKTAVCTVSVQASTISVSSVSLNQTEVNMQLGNKETLIATVLPQNATNQSVTWSTSNANILTVANGTITSKTEGTAIVTVTTVDGGLTDSCVVHVLPKIVAVLSVSLNKTSTQLAVGTTELLTATVYPTNATNKNVTWESSNTSVATVSNGAVTAKAAGSATISATTADGNKVATCDVVVTDPNAPVTAKFQFSNVSGRPGEIVKMKLSLKTEEEINSIAVSGFSYDTSVLTFVGFSDYEHIEELTVLPPTFDDDKKAVVIGLKEAAVFDDDICMLNFKIKDDANEGEYDISASSVVKLYSTMIQSSVTPGTLSISMQLLGDIDCNEKVDISDAIALFQYSMLPDLYPISYIGNIDFDKNGTVDIGDAVLLFQYSMLPDLYPIE